MDGESLLMKRMKMLTTITWKTSANRLTDDNLTVVSHDSVQVVYVWCGCDSLIIST